MKPEPGQHPLFCIPQREARCVECRTRSRTYVRSLLAPEMNVSTVEFECPLRGWIDAPHKAEMQYHIVVENGTPVCRRCGGTVSERPCSTCSGPGVEYRCDGCAAIRKIAKPVPNV